MNLIGITKIIDQYGYPGNSLVGPQAHIASTIIKHSNIEVQKKYLPLLKEAVQNNELKPSLLAVLVDKIKVAEGKKQIYGTQYGLDKMTKERQFYPIESPGKIDRTRKKIGLPPLINYAKHFNIKYDL